MQQNLHYFDDYLKVDFNLKFESLILLIITLFLPYSFSRFSERNSVSKLWKGKHWFNIFDSRFNLDYS